MVLLELSLRHVRNWIIMLRQAGATGQVVGGQMENG